MEYMMYVLTWCSDGDDVADRRWSAGLCAPLNFTPNLDGPEFQSVTELTSTTARRIKLKCYYMYAHTYKL